MSNSGTNPLSKHFRQPALYIKLPSGGKYWGKDAIELTATGELPIYPMTTKDEIILRTPDALANGTSVVQVIESCCPNIKDAWSMPSVDADALLLAIRVASYGPTMDISAKCPTCNEDNDYDLDLNTIMSNIQMPNYDGVIKTKDGLDIKLKPMHYAQVSKSGMITLEEQKLIQALSNPDLDDETRTLEYDKHIAKMIDLNIENISACTESIMADGESVTDNAFIKEYYANADGSVMRMVRAAIDEYAAVAGVKPHDATCNECQHQFKLNVEFDFASFFGKGF